MTKHIDVRYHCRLDEIQVNAEICHVVTCNFSSHGPHSLLLFCGSLLAIFCLFFSFLDKLLTEPLLQGETFSQFEYIEQREQVSHSIFSHYLLCRAGLRE